MKLETNKREASIFFILMLILTILSTQSSASNKNENLKQELNKAIKDRDIDKIENLLNEEFIPKNISVTDKLEGFKSQLNSEFRFLKDQLKPVKSWQIVRPVFKWGQNKEYIFISLKYSHRFDAPGCLDLIEQQLNIHSSDEDILKEEDIKNKDTNLLKSKVDGNNFDFITKCKVGSSSFKYSLKFPLFNDVKYFKVKKGIFLFLLFINKYLFI